MPPPPITPAMPPALELTAPRLIEKATNSTDPEVDPRLLKAIKKAVRFSDEEITASVEALMDQMKRPHSQVRYLAVHVVDDLFMRSKLFRTNFVINLDLFLSLSVGFRKNLPLPPPSAIAAKLRSKSIEILEKWNASFGIHYRQLRLGFDYLKDTLRFQFPNRIENAARMQQERRERQAKTMQILVNKFEDLKDNFTSIKSDIQLTVDEIRECLGIATIEKENRLHFPVVNGEFEEPSSILLRQIRLESLKEGDKVHENSENKAVFDALRESYKLLTTKHLPSVQEWISILVRVDTTDRTFRDTALKEFIDIRNLIQSVKKECLELGVPLARNTVPDEDEDLWEEGKVEAYQPDHTLTEPSDKRRIEKASSGESELSIGKISSSVADRGKLIPSSVADRGKLIPSSVADRGKLLADAPVLAWSPLLFDKWGSQSDVLANHRGLEVESHWGRVDPDAVIPAEKIAELNVHRAFYKEEPVEIKPCLARLKRGGLCQRRDLRMCPFHGPIIPRDTEGNPIEQGSPAQACDEKPSSEEVVNELAKDESLSESRDLQLARQAVRNVREQDREEKSLKRAKLAKVRKHNEEVLRTAAIASTSYSAEALRDDRGAAKAKKATLASMLKKKVTGRDRIAERLLNSRATDSSIRQLKLGEDSKYREAFPNQW